MSIKAKIGALARRCLGMGRRWVQNRALRALALLCAAFVLFGGLPTPVYAETAAEKYQRLKEELQNTRNNIEAYKNDISATQKLKTALEEEKALIDEMVEINRQEIERTEIELADKEQEIAEKRQVIFENDQLLQSRLVSIYKMNNSSAMSQVLSVDNFDDMIRLMDGMRRISKHDTDLLDMLNEQREGLETQQTEINVLLVDLQNYHDDLLQNQEDLAINLVDANNRLSYAQAQLTAQQEIEGEQYAALLQAQREMQAIAGRIGGSRRGDGSTYVGGVFTWPVPGYYTISCHFGAPDPNGHGHRGMDVSTNRQVGPDIVACGDGTVILADYAHSSYGQYIVIDHGDGVKTLYAHCSALYLSPGTQVSKGQAIAAVGSTGFSTGPHLHLEVLVDNTLQNPAAWLKG